MLNSSSFSSGMSKISPGASAISDQSSSYMVCLSGTNVMYQGSGGITTPLVPPSQLSHELGQIVIQWQLKFRCFLFPFIPFFLRCIIEEIFPSILKCRSTHNQITETLTSLIFKPINWFVTRLQITSQAFFNLERSYQIVQQPS